MTRDDVSRVLDGHGSYDDLSSDDQASVRQAWRRRTDELRSALNFEAEFAATGESWTEGDDNGNVTGRSPE